MNTISFRLKSEMKFQTVELDSTFVSIGELRRLICEQLALDQAKETVELWDHGANRARYSDDNKMISKGQKVMVARIPALQRRAIGNAAGEPAATPDAPAPEPAATDEFGGDVFNEQEQMKRLVEERSKDWGKDLATGAKAARFRRFQEEAAAATREGGGDEGAYKRKHTIHARGIPSSFLPRATVAKPADVDPSGVNAIKLLDGTVATLAGGELQAAEDAAIAAKQAAENAARAKPTLAPLAPLAFDDFALSAAPVDPMALVRAHFLPSAPVAEPLQLEAPRPATPALELTLAASAAPPSAQPRVPLPPDYSILNTCRAFLPHADHPEHLLKAFAIPTPLSRAEWNAFRALLPRSRRASPPRHRRRYSPSPERRRAASPLRRDLRTARGGDLRRGYVPERRDDDADERARRARRARLRSRSAERSEAETDARVRGAGSALGRELRAVPRCCFDLGTLSAELCGVLCLLWAECTKTARHGWKRAVQGCGLHRVSACAALAGAAVAGLCAGMRSHCLLPALPLSIAPRRADPL